MQYCNVYSDLKLIFSSFDQVSIGFTYLLLVNVTHDRFMKPDDDALTFLQFPDPCILHCSCIWVCWNGVAGTPSLKSYRTATTLCVPDLVFNDISRHRILLPEGTPVQREILTGMSFVIEWFVFVAFVFRTCCAFYCIINSVQNEWWMEKTNKDKLLQSDSNS